jgi:tetratricopeptide (TPR) repeat protein
MTLFEQKPKYWFVAASLFVSSISFAAINADSLKIAARQQRDSTLSDTYYQLARYYFQTEHQPDSMAKYAQLAAEVASKHGLTSRVMLSKKALGLAYTEARKFELAEEAYADAMLIAEQTNNTSEIIVINNKLGYLFGVANDLTKSIFYFLKTAKEFEQLKDYQNLALTYTNIVVIFTLQRQFDKVIDYTDKALALVPKLNQETHADMIVSVYSSSAHHYFLVGEEQDQPRFIDKALLFADSCLRVAARYNIKNGLADAYYISSHGYLVKKDYTRAIESARKALAYRNSVADRTIFNIYSALTKAYLEMNDFKSAQRYIDSCKLVSSSKEADGPMLLAKLEYHLYKRMKLDGAALGAYERFVRVKEGLENSERNTAINDLEVKYQTELREAKISELNQQAKINSLQIRSLIALVSVVLLVVVIIIFFYRQSLIKNRLSTMEVEQRLNRARMNPHFFFNALTSLQQQALKQDDGMAMASRLSQFSEVMRKTLESTYQEYITIEEEVAYLNKYLEIQKNRYPVSFEFSVNHGDELEINEVLIPPMIVQPFIENSIEHGLASIDWVGKISVRFERREEELYVEIVDNGKGLGEEKQQANEHISRATGIIKDRIYLLATKMKSKARFNVGNNPIGKGVLVAIYLPLIYKQEVTQVAVK